MGAWRDVYYVTRFEREHKNLLAMGGGIVAAYYILATPLAAGLTASVGGIGYLGAFIVGMLYSYGATTPIAIATFLLMSNSLDPIALAIVGGAGAVFSDLFLYRFVRNSVLPELSRIRNELKPEIQVLKHDLLRLEKWETAEWKTLQGRVPASLKRNLEKLEINAANAFRLNNLRSHPMHLNPKLKHRLAPLAAGLLLASPIPDEVAASLFGVIHYSTQKFLLYSYFIKFGGILLIAYAGIAL
ncbi:MAG: hypothetical protein ACE5PO_03505 [Candidatus Bathyarchaeia archaeon]